MNKTEYNYPRAGAAILLLAATLLSQSGCALLHPKLGGYTSPEDVDASSLVSQFRQLIGSSIWNILDKQSAQSSQRSRFPLQKKGAELIPSRHAELVTMEGDSLRVMVASNPVEDGFHCSITLAEPARGGQVVRKEIELDERTTLITHPGKEIGHLGFSEGTGFRMRAGNVTCQGGDAWGLGGGCTVEVTNVLGQNTNVSQGARLEQEEEEAQALCEEVTTLVANTTTTSINEETQVSPDTTIVGEMK